MEFQKQSTPHFHANVSLANAYQHKTLQEIGDLIESNLLSVDAIKDFQAWVCREEHFDQERHDAEVPQMTADWHNNYQSREHDAMSKLPAYIAHDAAPTMWTGAVSEDAAREDGTEGQVAQ